VRREAVELGVEQCSEKVVLIWVLRIGHPGIFLLNFRR
jgi:hypothetical protein